MTNPLRFAGKNQTQYLALKTNCTDEFQELPVMFLWEVTPQLRERLRQVREMCKLGSDINQIHLDANFKEVESLSGALDEWGERVLEEDVVSIPTDTAKSIDEQPDVSGLRGESIVVGDSYLWLTCYDKWTEANIESPLISLDDLLGDSSEKLAA